MTKDTGPKLNLISMNILEQSSAIASAVSALKKYYPDMDLYSDE